MSHHLFTFSLNHFYLLVEYPACVCFKQSFNGQIEKNLKMKKIRLAASSDLHIQEKSRDLLKPAFKDLNEKADIFAITGDFTASGKLKEIQVLLHELRPIKIPIVAVLGNHEYHNQRQEKSKQILHDEGIHILDGNCVTFEINSLSIGFSGSKGFLSGYDKRAIPDFGEQSLKLIVDELLNEKEKMMSGMKNHKT
ncbi:MAG: metallophosphoesterase, partial [Actinobacteria bacterium]